MLLGRLRLVNRCLLALALGGSAGFAVGRCATGPGPGAPAAAGVTPAPFFAGAASIAITPVVRPDGPPIWLAGFGQGRAASGVHDDLFARALVLGSGTHSVAIVALDLIGLFHDEVVRIREEIRARHPGVSVGYVMVCSTHTHAGPDVIGLWTPEGHAVDPAYLARVRSAAADAVAGAWDRRQPARLRFATADRPDLIVDSRLPRVIDAAARMLKVETGDGGATIATLLDFADHPESLGRENTLVSSDYPDAARRALEEAFGGVAIFVSADLGGLLTPLGVRLSDPDTGRLVPEKTFRMAETLGRELAGSVIVAWQGSDAAPGAGPAAAATAGGTIEVKAREFRVPLENSRFRRGLVEGRLWPRALGDDGSLASEAAVLTFRGTGGAAGGEAVAPLAQFACVPGEIYPELVTGGIQSPQDPGADFPGAPPEPALGSLLTARYRFIVGLCDDELGYIIPKSEWDEKPPFAYGRDSPQYGEMNSAGPQVAPILLDVFRDLLSANN